MKTLIRALVTLALVVWLGAESFFPVVAAVTFRQLNPDKHRAGAIVGELLRILHGIGLVAGVVIVALVALGLAWDVFRTRLALGALPLILAMMALTAYSQYGIIPAMERDRTAAPGGAVDAMAATDAARIDFDALHRRSEHVEACVLLLGIGVVVCVAGAQGSAQRS